LLAGEIVLAVEVHQVNATSSDIVFGLDPRRLHDVLVRGRALYARHGQFGARSIASVPATLAQWRRVRNAAGLQDHNGDPDPWVELFNSGSTAINSAAIS
jgi:hypothetical protein